MSKLPDRVRKSDRRHRRSQSRARLRDFSPSEDAYRLLFERNPMPMWVHNAENHRFLAVNDAAIEHYGYSRREFLSMTAKDVRPAKEVPRFLNALARGRSGLHFGGVWKHKKKDGTVLAVDVITHQLSFHGRPAFLVLLNDVTQLKKADETVRNLSARLLKAQDQERRRMARELHDSTAQSLSSLAINMEIVASNSQSMSACARRALMDSIELIEHCLTEVRSLAYLLHPPILDRLGIGQALKWFVAGYSDRSRIKVDLSLPDDLERLPPDVELAIYRIVQESLVNVQRHSRSSVAAIVVVRTCGRITVEIRDNGRGFNLHETASQGVGIPGMRERVRQLDGYLRVLSSQSGTTVRAVIPLE